MSNLKFLSLALLFPLFLFACNPDSKPTPTDPNSSSTANSISKEIAEDYQATHIINKRFIPLPFFKDNGEKFLIQEYQDVEVLSQAGDNWKIRMILNEELIEGEIPRISENGTSILVYLREYDEAARGNTTPCYEVRVKTGKAASLRNKPLSKEELEVMKDDRQGEVAVDLNRNSILFSLQKGVRVDLLDELDLWYKVKVHTRNFVQEGYISRSSGGKNTLKDWCETN